MNFFSNVCQIFSRTTSGDINIVLISKCEKAGKALNQVKIFGKIIKQSLHSALFCLPNYHAPAVFQELQYISVNEFFM